MLNRLPLRTFASKSYNAVLGDRLMFNISKGLKSPLVVPCLLFVCSIPFLNAQTATCEINDAVEGFLPTLLEPERYMGIAFTNTTWSHLGGLNSMILIEPVNPGKQKGWH